MIRSNPRKEEPGIKRLISILLALLLCCLLPAQTVEAQETVGGTDISISIHKVTVDCGSGGSFVVRGRSYSGTVDFYTMGALTITAVPNSGYWLRSTTEISGTELFVLTGNTIELSAIESDVRITLRFDTYASQREENVADTTDTTNTDDTTEKVRSGSEVVIDGARYIVTDTREGSRTVACSGLVKSKKILKIPSAVKIDGVKYKVTSIAAKAFMGDKKLTKVVIPNTITVIGKKAFYNCRKLIKVTFKGTRVKKIGSKAFNRLNAEVVIKTPSSKKSAYRKLLRKSGYTGKIK